MAPTKTMRKMTVRDVVQCQGRAPVRAEVAATDDPSGAMVRRRARRAATAEATAPNA